MSIEFSPAFDNLERASFPSRISQLELDCPSRPREADAEMTPAQDAEDAPAVERLVSDAGPIRNSKPISPRRLAANRRNAQRSTGPRTPAGKKRCSQNAIKHGLCSFHATRLPGECQATFNLFIDELREDLKPKTIADICTFDQLCSVLWRLERMPQSQRDIFQVELDRCADGETLAASEILARRFSENPSNNGFLLLDRYERSLRNQYLRLLNQLLNMQRNRVRDERDLVRWRRTVSTTDSNNDPNAERAWTPQKQAAQEAWFKTPEGQQELRDQHERNKRQREERDREEHEFAQRQKQLRIQEQEQKERELRAKQERFEKLQQLRKEREMHRRKHKQLKREEKKRASQAHPDAPEKSSTPTDQTKPPRRVPLQPNAQDRIDARDQLDPQKDAQPEPDPTSKTNPIKPTENTDSASETQISPLQPTPPGAERSHQLEVFSIPPLQPTLHDPANHQGHPT
jgi:hypothetical protein